MLKQSLSRNHRPKRLKLRCAFQICVLLALCIWLLYQMKQSYDKKVVLEQHSNQVLKLGRKDLNPKILDEMLAEFKGHHEDEEELDQESEDNKLKDGKVEEEGAADDEIDGGEQDKIEEEETEQIEDPIDEDDGV